MHYGALCWYTANFFNELLQNVPKCTILIWNFKRNFSPLGRDILPQISPFCPHQFLKSCTRHCLKIIQSGTKCSVRAVAYMYINYTSKQAHSSVAMISAVQRSSHHEPDDGSVQFSTVSCSFSGRHSITVSHELVLTLVMGPSGSFLWYLGKYAKQ